MAFNTSKDDFLYEPESSPAWADIYNVAKLVKIDEHEKVIKSYTNFVKWLMIAKATLSQSSDK